MHSSKIVPAFAALACFAPLAHAAVVLDAHYAPADTTFVSAAAAPPNYDVEDTAQTFTVEHTGILSQLDLLLQRGVNSGVPTGNLHWDIRPLSAGVPNPDAASALIGGDIPSSSITADAPSKAYVSVASLSLPVTAGEQLAIVLHNNGTNYFGWGADVANPADRYPGGGSFDRTSPATTFSPLTGFDQAFSTSVTVVPEPSAGCLLAIAVPALFGRRRKAQR